MSKIHKLQATDGSIYELEDELALHQSELDNSTIIYKDGKLSAVGTDSATFTPAVTSSGVLSWTNNKGLTNPDAVNIKGEKGDNGVDGSDYVPSVDNGTIVWVKNSNGISGEITELKETLDKKIDDTKSVEDTSDKLAFTDANGNIIAIIDKDGIHSIGFDGKNLALNDVLSVYEDKFYITDGSGNVIFKADKNGVTGLNMGGNENVSGQYNGMKLISIGDSLSSHDNWQKWVCEWTGMYFDNDENINGSNGFQPTAKGGTAIYPNNPDTIYMRALDTVNYLDKENGTVILVYSGQNDIPHFGSTTTINEGLLGTINDKPYLEDCVISEVVDTPTYTCSFDNVPTVYAYCKGLIQKLLITCPEAVIKIITPMKMWISDNSQSLGRERLVTVWKEIGAYYGCKVIDLWNDSGVSSFNAHCYYDAANNVHPSYEGYKNGIARTICAEI